MYRRLFRRASRKASRRRLIRYGLLTLNLLVLIGVSGFVAYGSKGSTPVAQNAILAPNDNSAANPLDQLSSADIAVHISRITKLPEASSVTEHADTVNAELAIAPSDEKVVAKPQIVATAIRSRKDIQIYTTQAGDTVTTLATKFNVTSDTIRWSNNLTGDALGAGKQLIISPINGIVVTAQASDSPDSLAQKYHANKDQIIAFNDAEVSGLPVGEKIVIPDGSLTTPTTRFATPPSNSFAWGGYAPVYEGNGYDYGYCTWWAAYRRAQIGRPVPSNLGNASTWKVLAQRAGLSVGNSPATGAVIWTPPRDYYGHVGFVESVDADGTVHVSEMNVVGWGRVSTKTLTADEAAAYSYIY